MLDKTTSAAIDYWNIVTYDLTTHIVYKVQFHHNLLVYNFQVFVRIAGQSKPRSQNVATERICTWSKDADTSDNVVSMFYAYLPDSTW